MLKVVHNSSMPRICICVVAIFAILFVCHNPTSATNEGSINTDVRIRPSLTLNITNSGAAVSDITLNLDPSSNPFDYQDVNISVGTNNAAGYILAMSAGSTDLVNIADSSKTIPTLASGSYTESNFPANRWGIKKDSGNYTAFTSGTLLSNSTRTNEDTTTLRFAAKIDYTKPSGLYEQDLSFVATANMATYYMQDLDAAVCSADPIEAIDLRDNQTYWVAELEDGNCWMLQNLQLGNNSNTITLNTTDSDVAEQTTISYTKTPNFPYNSTSDYTYDGWAFYCTPDSTNNYKSCYYNWYTATAGTGTKVIQSEAEASSSICPKGWRLPSGGANANANLNVLANLYPTSAQMLVANPATCSTSGGAACDNTNGVYKPGLLLSGSYHATGVNYINQNSRYWSRTGYSNAAAYHFDATTATITPAAGYTGKYAGVPVRCLRETRTLLDIDNMQDISPAIVGNTNVGAFKQLKDTRDNQYYMVGKLEDGNIWMLDNLNIDLFANKNVISPSNTHITGTVGINGLNAFKGTSIGTTSDRYATGAIASTNSDSSGNWTSSFSYSVPLQNRSGTCDPSRNSSYQCLAPYQNANYTYDTVIDKYGIPASDSSGTANVIYNIGHGSYKIGTYYNFCAATLGSYCYGNGSSGEGTPSGNATEADICPLGWRLPTGGTSGEYQSLATTIQTNHSATWNDPTDLFSFQTMLSTPMSGSYDTGTAFRQGTYGIFWSSTYSSATNMHRVYVTGAEVTPQNSSLRTGGYSVRCIAR